MKRPIEVSALYSALDAQRTAAGMSWREVAAELELSPSVFTRLGQGHRPDLDSYLQMTGWLGVSSDSFVGGDKASEAETENTIETIAAYLRADDALKPESAQAIERIVRAAYEEMASR
jgi:transcriptional regulator with XRE-family HTH domain